jgi:hypothetical protein
MNVETKEIKTFTVFDSVNQLEDLELFLDDEKQLVGYNNIDYDNPVMQFAVQNKYKGTIAKDVFKFSTRVISLVRGGHSDEIKYYKRFPVRYSQIDLMKIIDVSGNVPSLKMVGIILHWNKIQDLPYAFDRKVKNWDEANTIISYNINDVLISMELYKKIYDNIELRENLSIMYDVDLMNYSDSRMGDKLFEKFYCEKTGCVDVYALKDNVSSYEKFYVGECLFPDIHFQTNYMKRILREVSETLVRKDINYKFDKKITLGGVTYAMGSGGLHSEDFPAKFYTDENHILMDYDFSSFYPSMMIKNNIYPPHIASQFIDILRDVTKERVASKKTNKVKAAGLKVLINAIYGKLKFEGSWFRDAKCLMKVTVPGQLYLLMAIERFVLAGIQVISANTDGIVCRIPRHLESTYYKIANEFSDEIGIGVEFTPYEMYFRRDVNNYLSKKGDDVKTKGVYVPHAEIKKGYKYPVVAKAVYENVINGIPFENTLYNHGNILDFCASQKMGADFSAEYWDDATGEVVYLQKTNRFFISNSGGSLIKRNKNTDKTIGLYVGKKVQILNDFDESIPFQDYDIDYNFYLEECHALVDDVITFDEEMIPFEDEPDDFVAPQEGKERSELDYELRDIKNLSHKVLDNLVLLKRTFTGGSFFDLIVFAEENSMIASKWEDLIKINYFSSFGGNKKQLAFFEEFRKGKNEYASKLSEKSKQKRLIELGNLWQTIPDEPFSVRDQITHEIKILGKIQSVFPNIDRKYAIVLSLNTLYSPKAVLLGLSTGKSSEIKIQQRLFSKNPFDVWDVLKVGEFEKKFGGRFGVDEFGEKKWIENKEITVWWMKDWIVKKGDIK